MNQHKHTVTSITSDGSIQDDNFSDVKQYYLWLHNVYEMCSI